MSSPGQLKPPGDGDGGGARRSSRRPSITSTAPSATAVSRARAGSRAKRAQGSQVLRNHEHLSKLAALLGGAGPGAGAKGASPAQGRALPPGAAAAPPGAVMIRVGPPPLPRADVAPTLTHATKGRAKVAGRAAGRGRRRPAARKAFNAPPADEVKAPPVTVVGDAGGDGKAAAAASGSGDATAAGKRAPPPGPAPASAKPAGRGAAKGRGKGAAAGAYDYEADDGLDAAAGEEAELPPVPDGPDEDGPAAGAATPEERIAAAARRLALLRVGRREVSEENWRLRQRLRALQRDAVQLAGDSSASSAGDDSASRGQLKRLAERGLARGMSRIAESYSEARRVFRAGWLNTGGPKKWRRRFVVLYGDRLEVRDRPNSSRPRAVLGLDGLVASPSEPRGVRLVPAADPKASKKQQRAAADGFVVAATTDSGNGHWLSAVRNRAATLGYLSRMRAAGALPDPSLVHFLNSHRPDEQLGTGVLVLAAGQEARDLTVSAAARALAGEPAAHCTPVATLRARGVSLKGAPAAELIGAAARAETLTELDLSGNRDLLSGADGAVAEALASAVSAPTSALRVLRLDGCAIGAAAARSLAGALPRSALEHLSLARCGLSAESAAAIAAAAPRLHRLTLDGNADMGGDAVARVVRESRALRRLDVRRCGADAASLAESLAHSSVRRIAVDLDAGEAAPVVRAGLAAGLVRIDVGGGGTAARDTDDAADVDGGSDRENEAVDGRGGWGGAGHEALDALALCRDLL